jgi:hypothetical protein
LTFLRAVDAAEADAFRLLVRQNFDGIAVEDGDDGCCAPLIMWTGPLSEKGDMDTRCNLSRMVAGNGDGGAPNRS